MSDQTTPTETTPTETTPEDGELDLGLGDVIAFDSFVDKWEAQFNQWMSSLGFQGSVAAQVVTSVLIVIITFVLLWLAKRLVRFLRTKLDTVCAKLRMSYDRLNFLYGALYRLFAGVLILIALISLGLTWGLPVEKFITNDAVIEFLTQIITVYLLVMLALIILDLVSGLIEGAFHRWGHASEARINTLLPIAKNTAYIVLVLMFSLVALSELGIDVVPLLAGAGVIGFAVGFAAQAFIKDLLQGFIIILEDLIQVGDVVKLADRIGVVERITIRKVQLRDLSGTVYTVPFSEITIVENLTKEFSYAVFDVGVAYRENIDAVMQLLERIGKELQAAEEYKDDILEPLEILGLDQFADSAIIVKARMKTKPIKQWRVQREFNRRMKMLFDHEGVEIPFPHQTIYFGEDKDGKAPPLRLLQNSDVESTG